MYVLLKMGRKEASRRLWQSMMSLVGVTTISGRYNRGGDNMFCEACSQQPKNA